METSARRDSPARRVGACPASTPSAAWSYSTVAPRIAWSESQVRTIVRAVDNGRRGIFTRIRSPRGEIEASSYWPSSPPMPMERATMAMSSSAGEPTPLSLASTAAVSSPTGR